MEGRWVQFHPDYCPEAKGTKPTEWDTSHEISLIRPDGSRYRIGHFRHADIAGEVCETMNAKQAQR